MGMPVTRKGCTRQFIKLEEVFEEQTATLSEDVSMKKTRMHSEMASGASASDEMPTGSCIFRSYPDPSARAAAVVADLERRDAPCAKAFLP